MVEVSIVTISFNQADYLEDTILSVLSQNYPSIQYIVVDPGSTDGSRSIIERYRNRISRVIYQPDSGPSDGLNHGFEAATGSIFGYLNSDDTLLPGAVSAAVAMFNQENLAVVCGDGYFIDYRGRILRRCFSTRFSALRYALGGAVIMQQSSFWRREWHQKIGGFNIKNRTCWDGEFFFKVAEAGGRFRHVSQYWSCFRIHGRSITGSGRVTDDYLSYQRQMLAPYLQRYRRVLPALRGIARLVKYLENPYIIECRLRERLFGPPDIEDAVSYANRTN